MLTGTAFAGDKWALDVNLAGGTVSVEASTSATATITNTAMPTAGAEVAVIVGTVKRFSAKLRGLGTLKIAATSGGPYITVPAGSSYSEESLATASSFTLYFTSSLAGETLEIIKWA